MVTDVLSPGDQQVDGDVVERAQERAGARAGEGMVEGGGEVEQDEGGAEDQAGHEPPAVAVIAGLEHQRHHAGERQHDAEAVAHGVGDFLERR